MMQSLSAPILSKQNMILVSNITMINLRCGDQNMVICGMKVIMVLMMTKRINKIYDKHYLGRIEVNQKGDIYDVWRKQNRMKKKHQRS